MIIENIYKYIDFKGLSAYEFSKNISISNGYLAKTKKNNGAVGEHIIEKIVSYYSDIDPEWLITGKGSMLRSTAPDKAATATPTGIPLIPIDAMAGFGSGDVQVMDYDTSHYVVPEFEELKADFMIRVKGSSMQPKYSSGDILACIKIPLDTFFQWNKVYVLDTIQGALVKRIWKSELKDHLHIKSDNESYKSFDLHISEINALAIVVGVIRLE